jgi:hypothetical protein
MTIMKEAFREGMAEKIIWKLTRVLKRRIHTELFATTVPMKYINKYGKFAGYMVSIGKLMKFIRINFQLTSSDTIVSVDFYKDAKAVAKGIPTFTVDTVDENGTPANIVQVVDIVATELNSLIAGKGDEPQPKDWFQDYTSDDPEVYEPIPKDDDRDYSYNESKEDPQVKFAKMSYDSDKKAGLKFPESHNASALEEKGVGDRYQQLFDLWLKDHPEGIADLTTMRLADVYTKFLQADQKYNGEVNFANFTNMAKKFLFGRGLTNPTFRKKKKGSRERAIVDQAKADELEDMIENMGWEEKFDDLVAAVVGVAKNMIQGLVLWGSPGSGKSKTVYDTLESLNVGYHKFTGGLKTGDELFALLAKYSKNELIVFDDFDSVFKNLDLTNILKAATENKPKREITWRDKVLDFTSGIIFISNLTKFDSALFSRSMRIQIDLNNEQMIDKIEKTMAKFHPEVSMDIKQKALGFLKSMQGGVAAIDYRELEKTIIAIQLKPKGWERFALLMLKSGN